jgi:hypothetical protein
MQKDRPVSPKGFLTAQNFVKDIFIKDCSLSVYEATDRIPDLLNCAILDCDFGVENSRSFEIGAIISLTTVPATEVRTSAVSTGCLSSSFYACQRQQASVQAVKVVSTLKLNSVLDSTFITGPY